ncbi:MAG: efflux RND transporter periplasmic adaptor subunit, partial [Methyloglobulus sp.]|nr:efflux RND transporter periplasmic adaptor subunit [Methyloglobulus sp.]
HDDQQLWLFTDKQALDIRSVRPLWAEQANIYLDRAQLPENAKIITSGLAAPVQGMGIRVDAQKISSKQ